MLVINIRGVLVYLLLEIEPYLYVPFVTTDKKVENMIILEWMNAIYGTMVDRLLYYKKFVKKLKNTGFQINPYDPCVSNFLVKDKQKTICFHVDDWNLIHQYSEVNNEFINTLRDEYESLF